MSACKVCCRMSAFCFGMAMALAGILWFYHGSYAFTVIMGIMLGLYIAMSLLTFLMRHHNRN